MELIAFIVFIKEKICKYKLSKKESQLQYRNIFFHIVKPVLRHKMVFKCILNKENLRNPKITLSKRMKAVTYIMNHDKNSAKNYRQDEMGNNFKQLT